MKSVEDLDFFKLSHHLALKTYSATRQFPREELFSLGDQMWWAASLARGHQCAAHFHVSGIPETWKFPLVCFSLNS